MDMLSNFLCNLCIKRLPFKLMKYLNGGRVLRSLRTFVITIIYINCFVAASIRVFFADLVVRKKDLTEAFWTPLLFGFLLFLTCACG